MKRNIILVMAVSLMTTGVNAQLKVDANGRVGIKADTDESYTLRTHSTSSTTTGTLSVTRIPTSAASDPTRPWSVGTFSRATHNNSYNLYSFGIRAQATSETNTNSHFCYFQRNIFLDYFVRQSEQNRKNYH